MPGIVDGRKWLQSRVAFLEGRLAEGPPDEERVAIEQELVALREEMRAHGRFRWLRVLRRPSTDL